MSRKVTTFLALLFIGAAALSNWAVANIGQYNGLHAPRTIPVGWRLEGPSGVVLVGLMITVRDTLHERVGLRGTLALIVAAAAVSAFLSPASIAIGSGVTLLIAETADALVYQGMRRQGRFVASAASNIVSAIIDSAVFLLIAFGVEAARQSTWALTVGKVEASLITLVVIALVARTFRNAPTTSTIT